MKPGLVTHDGAAVVGVEIWTSNADESRLASARIPGLWQRFYAEGILDKIPGKRLRPCPSASTPTTRATRPHGIGCSPARR
jgi:hypothetical protein